MDWAKTTARRDEKRLGLGIGCVLYYRIDGTCFLGQFQQLRVHVERSTEQTGNKVTGQLRFPDMPRRHHVKVYEGRRRNMATKNFEQCWFVRHNGDKLLDGKIQNYKVPELMFTDLSPGLKKHFMLWWNLNALWGYWHREFLGCQLCRRQQSWRHDDSQFSVDIYRPTCQQWELVRLLSDDSSWNRCWIIITFRFTF